MTQYNTIDELQQRKTELNAAAEKHKVEVASLWSELTTPRPVSSKGEMIAALVNNSVAVIDGYLLVRKLIGNYGFIFKKKKKKQ